MHGQVWHYRLYASIVNYSDRMQHVVNVGIVPVVVVVVLGAVAGVVVSNMEMGDMGVVVGVGVDALMTITPVWGLLLKHSRAWDPLRTMIITAHTAAMCKTGTN